LKKGKGAKPWPEFNKFVGVCLLCILLQDQLHQVSVKPRTKKHQKWCKCQFMSLG